MSFTRVPVRHDVPLGLICLVLLASAVSGCKEPLPGAEAIDPALAGKWTVHKDESLRLQSKMYREAGVLKVNQDVFDFKRNFVSVHFDIELMDNARWTCTMGDWVRSGEFKGYWTSADDKVQMIQTHQDGKPKKDRMDGHFDGRFLWMTHQQDELSVPWVFFRVEDEN